MSCLNGTDCREPAKRRAALAVLGLMLAIFLLLSAWSFLPSRVQAIPDTIQYGGVDAVEGKRVFQAYNCMGCHTIVGNGAYFGPDLTRIYADAGPAWLAAFLPSAGGWPTSAAVRVQLQNPAVREDAGSADLQDYLRHHPGVAERLDQRGGRHTLMPNLPLDAHEVAALIAFLKYTSSMHTEGWPPKPREDRRIPAGLAGPAAAGSPAASQAVAAAATAPPATAAAPDAQAQDPVARGRQLVSDLGCVACHATDQKRTVGPGWGGLAGHAVELADGTTVTADEAYLVRSIRQPDAQIVAGYPPHVMPSYDALIDEADMKAIVAFLRSL
ncbi:c-type cytochrome [Castellaniella defragrans]|uniref:Cytochrome c2 n=3 Tax=Castellaniella defragrans TaxID=75697 RepID=A0A7W9TSN5_CASDE|nr:c-type cytochrome [Castellaniella defragrans]MBB6084797.1 cytochrome c2 [Castellaniella defragrans]